MKKTNASRVIAAFAIALLFAVFIPGLDSIVPGLKWTTCRDISLGLFASAWLLETLINDEKSKFNDTLYEAFPLGTEVKYWTGFKGWVVGYETTDIKNPMVIILHEGTLEPHHVKLKDLQYYNFKKPSQHDRH